jgi:subtilisin family serine protease
MLRCSVAHVRRAIGAGERQRRQPAERRADKNRRRRERFEEQLAHALEGFVVSVPWSQAQAVADELARNPAVDAVELDRALAIEQASTARTLDTRAWGVDRLDQRARSFDNLFRHTRTGQGVTAYVVDTGVSAHNQFGTRLKTGFSAVNDGQGTRDCHGHGTHVAGTVAGQTLGVAPGASIVPVRVLDCRGSGASTGVLAGLDGIAANGTLPSVVNMSLGGPASSSVDAGVMSMINDGITVVVAAGNDGRNSCLYSPARVAAAITVGASDIADRVAVFSNYGTCNDLFAPGSSITSAAFNSTTGSAIKSGTSMASPHVAGAAALLLEQLPSASPAQVEASLLAASTTGVLTDLFGGDPDRLLRIPTNAQYPSFTGVTPSRFLESRPGLSTVDGAQNGTGRVLAGSTIEVVVDGRAPVGAGAGAVVRPATDSE